MPLLMHRYLWALLLCAHNKAPARQADQPWMTNAGLSQACRRKLLGLSVYAELYATTNSLRLQLRYTY